MKLKKIKDLNTVVDLLMEIFLPYFDESKDWYMKQIQDSDLNLSMGLYDGENLIGFYLLKPNNIPFNFIEGNGLEGIALGIKKEYRGKNLAEIFFHEVNNMNFDYWWGTADIKLNNLHFWLKYRTFLMEYKNHYYTYKLLK